MKKYDILILTDHSRHSRENSVYIMAKTILQHPACGKLHVASRGNPENAGFFFQFEPMKLQVIPVMEEFAFSKNGVQFGVNTILSDARNYDVILLRLPRPIPDGFFEFLISEIGEDRIINRPSGIVETGSKTYLLNLQEICPPIKWCQTPEDVLAFQKKFPVVLKPVESYGGAGIVKIHNGLVFQNREKKPFEKYLPVLEKQFQQGGFLAMKYLKNVWKGDKRIIVVNGEIIGAVLRLPPKGSWMCNAAQGGISHFAEPDEKELEMARIIHENVVRKGVVIFGMDTLVDDNDERVLSEINTLSVGGIKQMAEMSGKPLVEKAVDALMAYINR